MLGSASWQHEVLPSVSLKAAVASDDVAFDSDVREDQLPLTPAAFATKWQGSTRTERAASQENFIDLCRMVETKTPNDADPKGEFYAFEKGAEKTGGGAPQDTRGVSAYRSAGLAHGDAR
jgi:hypothetical protein